MSFQYKDCNACGACNVWTRHWVLPSDQEDIRDPNYYGWDYCEECWNRVVKPANLEERGEPAPDFNDK